MAARVLIVTPTYDERENLEAFVDGVFRVLPAANVLVVDDASPDGTGQLADHIAARDPRLTVLHRPARGGLASAYREGFRRGLGGPYEIFFEMDADLSHDPRHLPAFLDALDEGADVVLGSRNVPGGRVEGWGPGRLLLSRGGSLYGRLVLGTGVRDLTTGYKAFRRRVLETIDLEGSRTQGYAFQIEWTWRALRGGFRIREVPITFVDRRAGRSKMSTGIFFEALVLLPRLRWAGRGGAAPAPRG